MHGILTFCVYTTYWSIAYIRLVLRSWMLKTHRRRPNLLAMILKLKCVTEEVGCCLGRRAGGRAESAWCRDGYPITKGDLGYNPQKISWLPCWLSTDLSAYPLRKFSNFDIGATQWRSHGGIGGRIPQGSVFEVMEIWWENTTEFHAFMYFSCD